MEVISQGLEGYRQLKHFKDPFKFWLLIILLPRWRLTQRLLASPWIVAPAALLYVVVAVLA